MKFILIILGGIFLFPAFIYCQEEFLGSENAINLSYSKANTLEREYLGLGVHLKTGFLFGITTDGDAASVYIGRLIEPIKETNFPTKPFISISYSRYNDINFLTPSFGAAQCFFMNTPFAFSLNGTINILTAWEKDAYGISHSSVNFAYSLGYTQSFFKDKIISPNIGLSYNSVSYEAFSMVHFGLNIRLNYKKYDLGKDKLD